MPRLIALWLTILVATLGMGCAPFGPVRQVEGNGPLGVGAASPAHAAGGHASMPGLHGAGLAPERSSRARAGNATVANSTVTQPPNDPASREQAFLLNTSMIVVPALFDGFAWVLDAEYQHALGGGWAVVVQTIDVALLPETDHEDEISLLGFGLYGGVKRSWGDGALDGFYLKAILGPFVLAPFDAEGEFAEDVGVGLMALGGLGYQWILELGFTAELGVALGAGGTFAQEPLLFPAANVEGRIGYAW